MADAIGLAASIVQIVSTGVQASVYLYSFAETVSSAGKAVKEISSDIALTTSVLEQLKTILESEKEHETASKEAFSAAEALIQECSNIFEAVVTLIQKHFPDLGPGHRTRSRLNFLKWPIIQPKIELMRSNLEKHKTKLILMTQVLTLAKMAVSQQREIEGQIERERQKLEALVIVSHRAKVESNHKVNIFGLTEVFIPTAQASVDIVFVHGIFGHPKDTWTCDDTDVFWPAELLPPILEDDGTRVLTYGYEAGADSFTDGEQRHKVHEVAGSLGRDLASNRQIRKATERPLIFIAHSLGGLIVKGVLAHSSRSPNTSIPNIKSISISTYGVVFLATPHNILASHMNLLCDTAIQKERCITSRAIERLKAKHSALHLLNQEFLHIAHEYRHHCFQEMLEPKILDSFSARLSMLHSEATCIYLDHYRISKFGSRFSHGFDLVCAVIQDFVNRAPVFISSRWEDEETKTRLQNNIQVAVKPSNDMVLKPRSGRGCYGYDSATMQFTGSSPGALTATLDSRRNREATYKPYPMALQVPEKPSSTIPIASTALADNQDLDRYFDLDLSLNSMDSVNELSPSTLHLIDAPEIESNPSAPGPGMEYPLDPEMYRRPRKRTSVPTSKTKRGRREPSKVGKEVYQRQATPILNSTGDVSHQSGLQLPMGQMQGYPSPFYIQPKQAVVPSSTSSPTPFHITPHLRPLTDVVLPPPPGMFRPSESSSEPLNAIADWTGQYSESRQAQHKQYYQSQAVSLNIGQMSNFPTSSADIAQLSSEGHGGPGLMPEYTRGNSSRGYSSRDSTYFPTTSYRHDELSTDKRPLDIPDYNTTPGTPAAAPSHGYMQEGDAQPDGSTTRTGNPEREHLISESQRITRPSAAKSRPIFEPSESSSEPLNAIAGWTGQYSESRTLPRLNHRPPPPLEVQQHPVQLPPPRDYGQHAYDYQSLSSGTPICAQSSGDLVVPVSTSQRPQVEILPLEQASLLPKYPGHDLSHINPLQAQYNQIHQDQAAPMKMRQILNHHASDTDLGQTGASDLTDDQVRQMDNHNFPTGILEMNGAFSAIPKDAKTWSELKSWLAQNQAVLPPGSWDKFQILQDLHFRDLVRQQWYFNNKWSPVEPNTSDMSISSMMHSRSQPTMQEIQASRARPPDHVKGFTDDRIQAEVLKQMQIDMLKMPQAHPGIYVQQEAHVQQQTVQQQAHAQQQTHVQRLAHVQQQTVQQQAAQQQAHTQQQASQQQASQQQTYSKSSQSRSLPKVDSRYFSRPCATRSTQQWQTQQRQAQQQQAQLRQSHSKMLLQQQTRSNQYQREEQRPKRFHIDADFIQDHTEFHDSKRPRVTSQRPRALTQSSSTSMAAEFKEQPNPTESGYLGSQIFRDSPRFEAVETHHPAPLPPLPPSVSELQTLDATEEERRKAKEEVLTLLRQWTTCNTSQFVERGKGSFNGVGVGVGVAPSIC